MQRLRSQIDRCSPEFRENRQKFLDAIERLNQELATAREGGDESYRQRHLDRGKLPARTRLELLLDPNTPFLELSPLAGWGSEFPTGGSLITGIGLIAGNLALVIINEPTIKGGAINPVSLDKIERAMQVAYENRLPTFHLIESGGADLPHQSRIFVRGGRQFREISRHSAMGLAQICLVFGNSTAGGAYIPGMSDYVVMVKNQAKVFLGGPPLVKVATGEQVDDESLGGALMHCQTSGVGDYLAVDDRDAIRIGREIASTLNQNQRFSRSSISIEPPNEDPEDLLGVVSFDVRRPYDVREVLCRLVDGSRFHEFKANYGPTLVTGFATLAGYTVGILANNGVLFSESALKGAHFIQLCNQRNIPILYLQNITGFMIGRQYEQGGIIKHGAKMVNAVANSKVPQLTMMIGGSFGAGNYAMCGRAYDPRFLFTWPNHRIAVMGTEQLAGVLSLVKRRAAERAGVPYDDEMQAQEAALQDVIRAQMEIESSAYFATSRLWDDGIIDPRQSRDLLAFALAVVHQQEIEGARRYGIFRM